MTRHGRLTAARATCWVEQYKGKDIVAGYATGFAVDPPCAVIELRMLGVTIDAEWESLESFELALIELRSTTANLLQFGNYKKGEKKSP